MYVRQKPKRDVDPSLQRRDYEKKPRIAGDAPLPGRGKGGQQKLKPAYIDMSEIKRVRG